MDRSTNPRSTANMIDCDFSPNNLMEEIDSGGWLNTTSPEGASDLNVLPTVGGRGSERVDMRSDARVHNPHKTP